jgi:putative tryptophan/tyrosine transport system substrate-binding protein
MKRRQFIALVGGAAAWPFAGGAQPSPIPVVGYLSARSPEEHAANLSAFHRGLNEAGYVETKNVAIEYRWEGDYERAPALAADLVRRQVTVIVTGALPLAVAAKAATSTIPIVFLIGGDPIRAGLVASLNRPGANLTGVSLSPGPLPSKRLQLLRELVPAIEAVGLLLNPNNQIAEADDTIMQEAARAMGLRFMVTRAVGERDFEKVFGTLVQERAGALVVNTDAFFGSRRDQIVALAARHAIPAIYPYREYALSGGLMSYGANLSDAYYQLGVYTGRVLKGAVPADLPVLQVTKFELVINLKAAKALGLTVPPTLLAQADEVIE